ncbi:MAG: AbrB family transcriptional regulator [Lautropia sp.]
MAARRCSSGRSRSGCRRTSGSAIDPRARGGEIGATATPFARKLVVWITTGAIGVAGGAIAFAIHWPLPWMIGSLALVAIASVAGLPTGTPRPARRVGQLVLGCAIGLLMTPSVAKALVQWLPVMLAGALLSIAASVAFIGWFQRVARTDRATAWFAVLPGGAAEMASISESQGGRPAPVALAQVTRVALTVTLVPPAVRWLSRAVGGDGSGAQVAAVLASTPAPLTVDASSLLSWAALALVGVAGGLLARRLRIVNPWLLGPLVFVAVCEALGADFVPVPQRLLAVAQVLLGVSLGTSFTAQAVRAMPAVLGASAGVFVFSSVVVAALAGACVALFGVPAPTAVLLFAMGGMTEMALTAKALHLDVPMVSAFQAIRVIVVNAIALWIWRRWLRPDP